PPADCFGPYSGARTDALISPSDAQACQPCEVFGAGANWALRLPAVEAIKHAIAHAAGTTPATRLLRSIAVAARTTGDDRPNRATVIAAPSEKRVQPSPLRRGFEIRKGFHFLTRHAIQSGHLVDALVLERVGDRGVRDGTRDASFRQFLGDPPPRLTG